MEYEFYPVYPDRWVAVENTHVRGNGFLDGECYDSNALASLFTSITSQTEFKSVVSELNGFFAVVHPIGDELLLSADHVRTIPLFYAEINDNLIVGSDSKQIVDRVDCQNYDPLREAEYILTGYVTGRETLCDRIYQVQAGELVTLKDSAAQPISRERYYRYQHDMVQQMSKGEIFQRLDDVLVSAFERLIDYADGRPIAVSMSGGYDSRLLISMLVRLDYENIITFTYDHTGDETDFCRTVASKLDVQWEHVTQDHEEWYEWYHSEERKQHDQAAGIIDAVPTNGPAIALKKIHDRNKIPDNSVVITGDAATATGEHIPTSLIKATDGGEKSFIDSILSYHYELWEYDKYLEQKLRDRIRTAIDIDQFKTSADVIDAFELWDWQERQTKHIFRNDLFEFWGYDWWYPLWDRELMKFLRTVPADYRFDRDFYEEYIQQLYADVAGLSINESRDSFHERSTWVTKVEQLLVGTPLKQPAEQVYRKYISPRKYDDNPIWGIMDIDQFESVHSGRQVIHAFRVLDVLGRMSFNPRLDGNIAKTGVVSVPTIKGSQSRESI